MNIFQVDSTIIKQIYQENNNYLVEYDLTQDAPYCTLYFSSHNIYFPNREDVVKKAILHKNKYEWYHTRIKYSRKHIFLRDVKKQWYLTGLNTQIDTPEKMMLFLKQETEGYRVICIGSSAGGFAAILYGSLLNAERVYTFNGQFEINGLLNRSDEFTNPLVFRLADNPAYRVYYDVVPYLQEKTHIFYFHSSRSSHDVGQLRHIQQSTVKVIPFLTKHHGIPFFKSVLPFLFSYNEQQLNDMVDKMHFPCFFSIKHAGIKLVVKDVLEKISTLLRLKRERKGSHG